MSATCSVPASAPPPTAVLAARPKSISVSGIIALAVRLTGAGGVFLGYVVLARGLGVGAFGEYALAVTWLQTLVVLAKLGLDNTSLRFVSDYVTNSDFVRLQRFLRDTNRACFIASLVATAGLILIVNVAWTLIGDSLAWSLIIAALTIPLLTLRQIHEAALRGAGRLLESQISTAIWPILLCVMSFAVVQSNLFELTSPLAMILHLVSLGAVFLIVTQFLRRIPILGTDRCALPQSIGHASVSAIHDPAEAANDSDAKRTRAVWTATALAFLLAESLVLVKSRTSIALAGMLLGRESVGLFAAMERISDVAVLGSQSLGFVIAPQFAALFSARRFPEMRRLMRYGQVLTLACTLPVAFGVALFSDSIFGLLGNSYRDGWGVLMTLLISTCIASFAGPGAYILQMSGRERVMLVITAASAATNLLLGLLLMPQWGIVGLGVAQLVSSLVWTIGIWLGLRNHPIWIER